MGGQNKKFHAYQKDICELEVMEFTFCFVVVEIFASKIATLLLTSVANKCVRRHQAIMLILMRFCIVFDFTMHLFCCTCNRIVQSSVFESLIFFFLHVILLMLQATLYQVLFLSFTFISWTRGDTSSKHKHPSAAFKYSSAPNNIITPWDLIYIKRYFKCKSEAT